FLMGLDDVGSACATISSEESHRVTSSSVYGFSQTNQDFAFVSNVPTRGNFQRGQSSNTAPRPNNLNYNRQSGGKIVFNNNVVGYGSSSRVTDEQMATIISLIKDNKAGKNVQANMTVIINGKIIDSGANQYMNNSDKELDNVYDISHLKIKVAHPNGIEAFISKIVNLKLPNDFVLFDVLVIPEYCVTLISVHKLGKVICMDIAKITRKWLGHPADTVLNVLKKDLKIDNQNHIEFYEICQRAKQTREPFPLSDHSSSKLGDLVHLDLWGPYKVSSSERFKSYKLFDNEYPEMPYDDERVDPNLNSDQMSQSDSSHYFVFLERQFVATWPLAQKA
ncbi:hypothetical protein Tco_1114756, partial [Tanacetum coccineum]